MHMKLSFCCIYYSFSHFSIEFKSYQLVIFKMKRLATSYNNTHKLTNKRTELTESTNNHTMGREVDNNKKKSN